MEPKASLVYGKKNFTAKFTAGGLGDKTVNLARGSLFDGPLDKPSGLQLSVSSKMSNSTRATCNHVAVYLFHREIEEDGVKRIRLNYYATTTLSSHLDPGKRDIDLTKQANPGSEEQHTLLDLLVPNSAEPSAIPLPAGMPLLDAHDPYSGLHQYGFFDFCNADGRIYLCNKRSYTILVEQTMTLDRDTTLYACAPIGSTSNFHTGLLSSLPTIGLEKAPVLRLTSAMTAEIIPMHGSRIPVPAGAGGQLFSQTSSGKSRKDGVGRSKEGGGSASGSRGGHYGQQRDAGAQVAEAGGTHGVVDGVGVGSAEDFIARPAAGACSHGEEEECDDGIEYFERVISSLAGYDIAAQRREEATASWVRSLGGPS